jgi:hypothetical protein
MKSSSTIFTKIADLSPNMPNPLVHVIVDIDLRTVKARPDGSGQVLVGDASGSILMSFTRNFLDRLDVQNSKPLAWVLKNCMCIVIGERLMLQVSNSFTDISRLDKLPVKFFHRNKARNLSDYEYETR